jgi:arylsulfatase A-like enzyme
MRMPRIARAGRWRLGAGVLAVLTAGASLATWSHARSGASAAGLVIVTLDTTRADRLSPYGLMDVSMPAFERLAREGMLFDQAWSVAPLTLPAHTSLFTGVLPPAHGVRDNADRLAPGRPTLAETLKANGFRTAAFVGSAVLDASRGLARGFDVYAEAAAPEDRQRRGDEVMDAAIAWLEKNRPEKFFLWVHLYDPHRPYDPPASYRSRAPDPYIGEIVFADAQVGRLLDAIERRNATDRTVVVVAGDHGESLGEHGERDHGVFVYESVLRVPLIVRGPGIVPGRTPTVVRLVDVMPTVLQLAGIDPPETHGVSLVPLLNGSERHLDLEAYAESLYPRQFGWTPLRTLRDGRFKVIDAPRPELYDLARDPFEERNMYDTRRPLADAMLRRLRTLAAAGPSSAQEADPDITPDAREDLAALGYVGTPYQKRLQDSGPLPDPKDCMPEHDPALRGSASDGVSAPAVPKRSGNGC